MRDTLRLRRHLTLLACLPIAASACDSSASEGPKRGRSGKPAHANVQTPQSAEPDADRGPSREESTVQSRGAKRAVTKARKGPIINEAPAPTSPEDLPPQQRRLLPIPGDPPWIDGYSPEEDPCPSGNWCGTVKTAMVLAPNPDLVAKEMDCPARISGSHDPSPIEGPAYTGLSSNRAMQGSLNEHGTELARAGGKADACCYHWFEYCSGRPFMDDRGAHRAAPCRADGWSASSSSPMPAAEGSDREQLAQAWLTDALDEHASVASFARATLELMAVGAPADLLADTQRAALDEIVHAQLCFTLARRFGAEAAAPGPLPALGPRAADLPTLARNVFLEGCVGETIAALVAERAGSGATDPQTTQALATIASDEARHAALAWRTVAWALRQDRDAVTASLRAAASGYAARASQGASSSGDDHSLQDSQQRWGRLSAPQRDAANDDAWREIIVPMLERLLA